MATPTTTITPHAPGGPAAEALSPACFAEEADRGIAVVVDLREADERVREGSIWGALHVPRGTLELRADPVSPDRDRRLAINARVLLMCDTGVRSRLATATLAELGFRDVAYLDGGLLAWRRAGFPVVGRQAIPY
jgi:rhodanese-related sulfurtransferase